MTPQAAAGTVLSYTPPVTGFRFRAGALAGAALTAALDARIGNDVDFLLHRPYFTGYQSIAQTGFPNTAGFRQITIDTVGALPRGGNGDSYGGWSASNHWYVSQVPGWYLVIADLYAVHPPSGTAGILTAGIFCSSSGGVTPAATPDNYQQVYYPTTDSQPPGAFAMGMYYLAAGEYVYPMLSASSWGGTWGTQVSTGTTGTIHSQLSVFLVLRVTQRYLIPRREATGRSAHGTGSEGHAVVADRLAASAGHRADRRGPVADHQPGRRPRPVLDADRGGAGADGAGGGNARGGSAVRAIGHPAWGIAVLVLIAAGWGAGVIILAAGWGTYW